MSEARTVYRGRRIDILSAKHRELEMAVADCDFIDCTVVGPAVMIPYDVSFEECVFGDGISRDTLLWVVPNARNGLAGAVGLIHCSFIRCRLESIGFVIRNLGGDAFLEALREGTTLGPVKPPGETHRPN